MCSLACRFLRQTSQRCDLAVSVALVVDRIISQISVLSVLNLLPLRPLLCAQIHPVETVSIPAVSSRPLICHNRIIFTFSLARDPRTWPWGIGTRSSSSSMQSVSTQRIQRLEGASPGPRLASAHPCARSEILCRSMEASRHHKWHGVGWDIVVALQSPLVFAAGVRALPRCCHARNDFPFLRIRFGDLFDIGVVACRVILGLSSEGQKSVRRFLRMLTES